VCANRNSHSRIVILAHRRIVKLARVPHRVSAQLSWHSHSCVKFQDILYTVLSGHPLHIASQLTQRSTAVDRWVTRSSSRTRLRQ
jgi:hypothetical protein